MKLTLWSCQRRESLTYPYLIPGTSVQGEAKGFYYHIVEERHRKLH